MAEKPPLPLDYEELPFKILEEVWNEYELQDDTILKARVVLLKLLRPNKISEQISKDQKQVQIGFQSQNHVVAYSPANKRGQPTPPLTVPQMQKAEKYKVKVQTTNEPWNLYQIIRTGATVKTKLVVNEVYRVKDNFGPDGAPLYYVTSGPLIQLEPPSKSAQTP